MDDTINRDLKTPFPIEIPESPVPELTNLEIYGTEESMIDDVEKKTEFKLTKQTMMLKPDLFSNIKINIFQKKLKTKITK